MDETTDSGSWTDDIDYGAFGSSLANTAFSLINRGSASNPAAAPPNSQAPAQVSGPRPASNNTPLYIGAAVVALVLVVVLIKR